VLYGLALLAAPARAPAGAPLALLAAAAAAGRRRPRDGAEPGVRPPEARQPPPRLAVADLRPDHHVGHDAEDDDHHHDGGHEDEGDVEARVVALD